MLPIYNFLTSTGIWIYSVQCVDSILLCLSLISRRKKSHLPDFQFAESILKKVQPKDVPHPPHPQMKT